MLINWDEIEESIINYYKEIDLTITTREIQYLKEAFLFTEKLWEKQVSQIEKIKYVMISEAPLFGKEKKYFYNEDSNFSSFFYFKSIDAFGVDYSSEDYNNKKFVLKALNQKGFIILDLFPFALNQKDTQINYNSIKGKKYFRLFEIVIKSYLHKKLKLIKSKSDINIIFLYRYKRLKDKLGGLLERELIGLDFIKEKEELVSINYNMSIHKERLKSIVNP